MKHPKFETWRGSWRAFWLNYAFILVSMGIAVAIMAVSASLIILPIQVLDWVGNRWVAMLSAVVYAPAVYWMLIRLCHAWHEFQGE